MPENPNNIIDWSDITTEQLPDFTYWMPQDLSISTSAFILNESDLQEEERLQQELQRLIELSQAVQVGLNVARIGRYKLPYLIPIVHQTGEPVSGIKMPSYSCQILHLERSTPETGMFPVMHQIDGMDLGRGFLVDDFDAREFNQPLVNSKTRRNGEEIELSSPAHVCTTQSIRHAGLEVSFVNDFGEVVGKGNALNLELALDPIQTSLNAKFYEFVTSHPTITDVKIVFHENVPVANMGHDVGIVDEVLSNDDYYRTLTSRVSLRVSDRRTNDVVKLLYGPDGVLLEGIIASTRLDELYSDTLEHERYAPFHTAQDRLRLFPETFQDEQVLQVISGLFEGLTLPQQITPRNLFESLLDVMDANDPNGFLPACQTTDR